MHKFVFYLKTHIVSEFLQMEGAAKLSEEVLSHIQEAQQVLKQNQRRATVEQEIAKFKSPGTKRNVKFARNLLFNLQDMEEILKVEPGEEFASVDNVQEVNAAITALKKLMEQQKETIQHELNMQVIAATSSLKWKVVKHLEGGSELPECVTVPNADLRKAEKESMAYERDLRTAASFTRKRGATLEQGLSGKRGRWSSGRGRGGAVGNSGDKVGRACFKCGSTDHLIGQCPNREK